MPRLVEAFNEGLAVVAKTIRCQNTAWRCCRSGCRYAEAPSLARLSRLVSSRAESRPDRQARWPGSQNLIAQTPSLGYGLRADIERLCGGTFSSHCQLLKLPRGLRVLGRNHARRQLGRQLSDLRRAESQKRTIGAQKSAGTWPPAHGCGYRAIVAAIAPPTFSVVTGPSITRAPLNISSGLGSARCLGPRAVRPCRADKSRSCTGQEWSAGSPRSGIVGRSQARSGNQTVAGYSGHGSPLGCSQHQEPAGPQALPRPQPAGPPDPGDRSPLRRAGSPRLFEGRGGGAGLTSSGNQRLSPLGSMRLPRAGITAGFQHDLPALALAIASARRSRG